MSAVASGTGQGWDEVADVVVVGYGAAGSAAAITAHDRGASALLLEKQDPAAHTPSIRMSGGIVLCMNDAEAGARYLDACAGGLVPEAVSRAWAARAARLRGWLDEVAPQLGLAHVAGPERPQFPGADAVEGYQAGARFRHDPESGMGRALFAALASAVEKRDLPVRWHTAARRLVVEDGRVVGVEVEQSGGPAKIRARKGVVLTCGGYEFDDRMKAEFLPAHPIYFYGNPGNTGDGVRMAQDVGADLWHMNRVVGRAIAWFPLDDGRPQGFMVQMDPPGYVLTDRYGHRFANEHGQAQLLHDFYHHLTVFDSDRGEHPRMPCYWFFDDRRRRAGPLTWTQMGAVGVGMYDWSPDNRAEIDRGWIHGGDTVENAAAAAGIADPVAAARTVADYNAGCATGVDAFGRPFESLVPLEEPPFWCVPLWPGGSNTTGGPRRDERGRVVDVYGEPIPGLYAAGELGQVSGMLYPGDGTNLSEALCFGQIAVETALDEG